MAKNKIKSMRIKGLLTENEMTVSTLAKKMGISESSLQQKILGNRGWWYEEVVLVTKIFGFTEIKDVFPELSAMSIKK